MIFPNPEVKWCWFLNDGHQKPMESHRFFLYFPISSYSQFLFAFMERLCWHKGFVVFTSYILAIWWYVSLELMESFWVQGRSCIQELSPYFILKTWTVLLSWMTREAGRKVCRFPDVYLELKSWHISRYIMLQNGLAVSCLCSPHCIMKQ